MWRGAVTRYTCYLPARRLQPATAKRWNNADMSWYGRAPSAMEAQQRQAEKAFVSDSDRTFQFEEQLPSLPIPRLSHTLQRYLDSVLAVASCEEYEHTRRLVQQFEHGQGRQLQQMLGQRNQHTRNWALDWWNDYAYLYQREPILPSLSFAGPFTLTDTLWPPGPGTQCEYMARFLYNIACFWGLLRRERLAPQKARDGRPLSMYQWRFLFSTTRIPGKHKDTVRALFQTESEGCTPTHCVLMCNGHMYSAPLLEPGSEQPLTIEEYRLLCERVLERSVTEAGPGLPALTTDQRPRWAENREYLRALSPGNAAALEVVETAVCHAVLEMTPAGGRDQCLRGNLCGDGATRWADKSMTAVVWQDGYGGTFGDHSPMDAMTLVTKAWFSHLQEQDFNRFGRLVRPVRDHLCHPRRLEFQLDHRVRSDIQTALDGIRPLIRDVVLISRRYTRYGKQWIQSQSLHPDAYVQVALQLAYFRLHGRPAPTYETATTRRFYRARTETVRSCTPQTLDFCRAMTSQSALPEDRRRLLRVAVERHTALTKEAADGSGCDRHLLGLQIQAAEAGLEPPEIFTDPMWKRSGGSGNFVLSTSISGYTPCVGATVAMVKNGYGCFYSIEPDRINMNVSGYLSSAECDVHRFYSALEVSLDDIQQLMLSKSSL